VFTYHWMWAVGIAIANAMYGWLFPDDKGAGGAGAVQTGLRQDEAGNAGAGAKKGSGRAHSSRAKKQKTH
jgi:hypothetical protein